MTASTWFLIGVACAVVGSLIALALMRANGRDTDADQAADSVRQALDPDARFDELRDYTRPHIKAGTAWGREL